MEKAFDARALLVNQLSFAETKQPSRLSLLNKQLKKAKKAKSQSEYWTHLAHAASQIGYDDEVEENTLIENLDVLVRSSN